MTGTRFARIAASTATTLALLSAAALFALPGNIPVPFACSALSAASALAAALTRGKRRKKAFQPASAGGEGAPGDDAAVIPPGRAEEARVAATRAAESLDTETRATVLSSASALRRLRFADAVLGKVPPMTEEAAFSLMERLVALRDQSAKAAEAAASVEEDSTNAEKVAELAAQARQTMKSVQASLAEMRKHDRDATSGLKSLGEELKSGIELLAGIEEITERSRLIAFNMAIEAARIGEKGRGFKVIVGELRALNDRTADFSRQVSALLGRFKMHNEDLVESAIASSLRVAEDVDAGVAEEELAIESLLGASTACLSLSDSVTDSVRAINRELDGILESLQFQDITRQMIEGALLTMAEAEADIAPLASRDGKSLGRHEEARLVEALRETLLARARTKGEKEAIQEVRK